MPEPVFENAPLIIVGCQRSGTTLLKTMLSQHPKILAHPDEPQFILGLYHRFGTEIKEVNQAVAYVAGHSYFPPSVDKHRFKAAFRGLQSVTLRSFMETYLRIWGGEDLDYKLPLLKHPELVYHLDIVSGLFPRAMILHIVRDPRSNVLSQRNRWPQFSVSDCAILWKKAVRSARSWAEEHTNRFLEIKYEDLITKPESALMPILSRTGLRFTPRMLSFDYPEPVYSSGRPEQRVVYNKVDPTRMDSWRAGLTHMEIKRIEHICKSEMHWWNYRPDLPIVAPFPFAFTLLLEWLRNRIIQGGRSIKQLIRRAGWRLGVLSRTGSTTNSPNQDVDLRELK